MTATKWPSAAFALCWLTSAVITIAADPLVEARHHAPSFKREAEERYSMHSETALVASSCRPEIDGFFGGTSSKLGSPVQFDYVFQIESVESADLNKALVVIYDRVIDSILSDSFPSICSVPDRRLQKKADENSSRITGFKFNEPQMDLNDHCDPFLDPKNYCGYFKGKVQIFGQNLVSDDTVPALMELTLETVEETQSAVSDLGVVRVLPSSKMSTSTNKTIPEYGGDGLVEDESTGYNMTPVAKASFAMASFTMVLGVICLIMWVNNDLKRHRNVKILDNKVGGNGLFNYFTPRTFPDDTSRSTMDGIYLQDDYHRGYADIVPTGSDLDYVFEDSSQAGHSLRAYDQEMNPRATYT
ncbi:hypothetical protein FisN_15Lh077 [Fistulifera solaris]|uniref:Uncharacterized protein n=1 Tax=Fistulifera solaris TaxID=1519565 RepID=A0A1Z5KB40_FISSO|nr:hypothetical protein FisN_15Lh077 [Fistulifera solaris]|eukprot:GAX23362.1 hypothetical protein FisN_15Lh077 [Fistulifera solaris]